MFIIIMLKIITSTQINLLLERYNDFEAQSTIQLELSNFI